MNKIDYAIGILENNLLSASVCADVGYAQKHNQVIRLAIEALKEKQERSKGCEYCNGRFGIASHHINEAGLQAGTKRVANYCPNCGAKMESEGGT